MNEMSGVEAFVRMMQLFGVKHIWAVRRYQPAVL
jgi:hypothetical protein